MLGTFCVREIYFLDAEDKFDSHVFFFKYKNSTFLFLKICQSVEVNKIKT